MKKQPMSAETLLDELLQEVAVQLQITETQFKKAESAYGAVGEWLAAPASPLAHLAPYIHAQGSMALQTTTKPRTHEEFDLDMVLMASAFGEEPMQLYHLLLKRLDEHEVYRPMLQPMRRCIRLVYAGNFHLDVLPARADTLRGGTCIEVPDRKDPMRWKPSNPLGYQRWFEGRAHTVAELLAKRDQVPLVPEAPAELKTVLQRVVQLVKRQRDIAFGDDDAAPRSVVLTTLLAHQYRGERSLSKALVGILDHVAMLVNDARPHRIVVLNPTNPDEDFSEAWDGDRTAYEKFGSWLGRFRHDALALTELRGLEQVGAALQALFGEEVGRRVVEKFGERLADARRAGALRSTAAGLTTTGIGRRIPKNTNFGK